MTNQDCTFVLKEYEIIPPSNRDDHDKEWVSQWHGMSMLRASFSDTALLQHAAIFEGARYEAHALEAFALMSIMGCYPDQHFFFMELGSGRAPWCLAVAGVIANRLIPTPPRECSVVALEAEPTHYAWSKKDLLHNGINGKVLHGAIGEMEGTCRFTADTDPAGHMGQHVSPQGNINVRMRTIDAIMKQLSLERVHAVHMDVQGQEVAALRGAKRALAQGMIDFFIIGTHSPAIEEDLRALLAPTHELVAWLPIRGTADIPGFSRSFRTLDDGVQIYRKRDGKSLLGQQPGSQTSDCDFMIRQGERLFREGGIAEARALFSGLTQTFPACHDAWNNLGVTYFMQKEFGLAADHFRSGFALCQNDAGLATNYIQALTALGRLDEALDVARLFVDAGGDQAVVAPLVDRLRRRVGQARNSEPLQIAVASIEQLQTTLGFHAPLAYPQSCRETPLDRWKMEINDAPIFRYLYRNFRPRRHLEFGTWQGAGTVYCLEECDAAVWTINLPFGEERPEGGDQYGGDGDSFGLQTSMAQQWAQRIGLPAKSTYRTDCFGFIGRFYLEKGLGHRVSQVYCDSTQWDDTAYPDGFFDSILVDGGHSPDVVVSDTQKALRLLRPGGLFMWHDFCPPVAEKFPVTRGVRDGLAVLADRLAEEMRTLFWINPSWILLGLKK